MSPEFVALCQRAKAAKHFAWEPGMRVFVPGPRVSVAIAAILHEFGGWVLAEDWTQPEAT